MRRAIVMVSTLVACGGSPDAMPDAPETCSIPPPGSRCASATTLERCNGKRVDTIDCAASGSLCGPDPAAISRAAPGSACIADGQACGWIPPTGACDGSVLARCGRNMLVVSDCVDRHAICSFVPASSAYQCRTVCQEMNVTAEGNCVAGGIQRCVFANDQFSVQTDACPTGSSCQTLMETGAPACLPTAACVGIGPEGKCSGNTLVQCVGGTAQMTDCAATNAVCGYGGSGIGYHCAAAGSMGAFVVAGSVRYEDRPPLADGLGALTPAPARGVTVALVRTDGGAVLASAVTADDGSYTLRYDAPNGVSVYVLAATTTTSSVRPVRVIRPDGLVHGFASPSFQTGGQAAVDLLATDRSAESEAFNIFDQGVRAMDFLRTQLSVSTPQPLFFIWVRGATDGTYYSGGIFLLGSSDDDDGYDDAVILHETGHYIEKYYGHSDSPGGSHDGSPTDPRLAWSEGFATYWNMAVRNEPTYMDSNADGGWSYNADTSVTTADLSAPMSQRVSENTVSEILWDVTDSGSADDDPLTTGSAALVLAVEPLYLAGPRNDRGVSGVDLIDWLDGWFIRNGLASCNPMRSVVTLTRHLPYDYNGAAGMCP